jgi:ferric-dicitrate binding protein FerR (iron transport regulator)
MFLLQFRKRAVLRAYWYLLNISKLAIRRAIPKEDSLPRPQFWIKILGLLALGAGLAALSLWGIPKLELQPESQDLVTILVTVLDFAVVCTGAYFIFKDEEV